MLDRGGDAALGWRGHGTALYVAAEWGSAAVASVLLKLPGYD